MANDKDNPQDVAANLKKRFSAGATPNATDYSQLIELADRGRKAIGLSENLEPIKDATSGLVLDDGHLKVHHDPNTSGLTVTGDGVAVHAGKGINVTKAGVEIKSMGALVPDTNGNLQVTLGAGLQLDEGKTKIELHLDKSSGLGVTDNALTVQLTKNGKDNVSGLEVSTGGTLQLRVNTAALTLGADGVALTKEAATNLKAQLEGAVISAVDQALKDVAGYKIKGHSGTRDTDAEVSKLSKLAQELENGFRQAITTASQVTKIDDGWTLTGWAGALYGLMSDTVSAGNQVLQVDDKGGLTFDPKNDHGFNQYFASWVKTWIDEAQGAYEKQIKDGNVAPSAGEGLAKVVATKLALAYTTGKQAGFTSPEEFQKICNTGVEALLKANGATDPFKYSGQKDFLRDNYWMIAGAAAAPAYARGKSDGAASRDGEVTNLQNKISVLNDRVYPEVVISRYVANRMDNPAEYEINASWQMDGTNKIVDHFEVSAEGGVYERKRYYDNVITDKYEFSGRIPGNTIGCFYVVAVFKDGAKSKPTQREPT